MQTNPLKLALSSFPFGKMVSGKSGPPICDGNWGEALRCMAFADSDLLVFR
jgi:hypothetical protein